MCSFFRLMMLDGMRKERAFIVLFLHTGIKLLISKDYIISTVHIQFTELLLIVFKTVHEATE